MQVPQGKITIHLSNSPQQLTLLPWVVFVSRIVLAWHRRAKNRKMLQVPSNFSFNIIQSDASHRLKKFKNGGYITINCRKASSHLSILPRTLKGNVPNENGSCNNITGGKRDHTTNDRRRMQQSLNASPPYKTLTRQLPVRAPLPDHQTAVLSSAAPKFFARTVHET